MMWKKGAKYGAVFRISLSQQFAYFYDFLIRTLFLILILFVFSRLWITAYTSGGTALIEGYTVEKMMWYLMVTESIYLAFPALVDRIEKDVKNGEIAYFLNRPISYIGFQYGQYLSEAVFRVAINLCAGSVLIYFLAGGIPIPNLLGFIPLVFLALTLQYVTVMAVCLSSFWVEDIRGFHLVYSRLLMIIGGMMVPLEIFPEWLQHIARILPFQSIIYLPASFFVGAHTEPLATMLIEQGLWLVFFTLILLGIYRLGVKRLNVNGG